MVGRNGRRVLTMPLYEYMCDACGRRFDSFERGDRHPCECGLSAQRRFGFRPARSSFTGGYNPSVGRYVGSLAELRSAFSEESDRQSRETGIDVDIQPIDYSDREAVGITDADIDRIKEEKSKAGITP